MAFVTITLKVMPENPETDLNSLKEKIEGVINSYEGKGTKVEEEAIAFGLIALKFMFNLDESKGNTDSLEESIKNIEGVNSVEVVDVRRALG